MCFDMADTGELYTFRNVMTKELRVEYFYAPCCEQEGQVYRIGSDIDTGVAVKFYGVYKMILGDGSTWICDYESEQDAIAVVNFMNKFFGGW